MNTNPLKIRLTIPILALCALATPAKAQLFQIDTVNTSYNSVQATESGTVTHTYPDADWQGPLYLASPDSDPFYGSAFAGGFASGDFYGSATSGATWVHGIFGMSDIEIALSLEISEWNEYNAIGTNFFFVVTENTPYQFLGNFTGGITGASSMGANSFMRAGLRPAGAPGGSGIFYEQQEMTVTSAAPFNYVFDGTGEFAGILTPGTWQLEVAYVLQGWGTGGGTGDWELRLGTAAVPEPAEVAIGILGCLGFVIIRRRASKA